MTKSKKAFVLGLAISMLMSTAVLAAEPATIAGGGIGGVGSDISQRTFNPQTTGNEAIQSTPPQLPVAVSVVSVPMLLPVSLTPI